MEVGTASAAILMSLFETLVAKDVLAPDDVTAVLKRAADRLKPHSQTVTIGRARSIIENELLSRQSK
jgi:hypothetical protein